MSPPYGLQGNAGHPVSSAAGIDVLPGRLVVEQPELSHDTQHVQHSPPFGDLSVHHTKDSHAVEDNTLACRRHPHEGSVLCPFESTEGDHPVSLADKIGIDDMEVGKCSVQMAKGLPEAVPIGSCSGQGIVIDEAGCNDLVDHIQVAGVDNFVHQAPDKSLVRCNGHKGLPHYPP